jgi:hypothetical protein
MWTCFGLAFLTKGPPGLLPLAALLLFRAVARRGGGLPSLRWLPGLALFLAIGGSWFVLVVLQHAELGRYFLYDELVLRVFSEHHDRNAEWYKVFTVYAPIVLFGTLPWTRPVWRGLRRLFDQARHAGWRRAAEADPRGALLGIWIALPLLVFLLARSRMPLYLLPLFAPLALIAAGALERDGAAFTRRRAVVLGFWVAALLGLRVLSGVLPFSRDARAFAAALRSLGGASSHEAVFVETSPYRALSFYMDLEVEELAVGPDPVRQSVAEEIHEQEPEEPRLWIVPDPVVAGFLAQCSANDYGVRQIGDVSTKRHYCVFVHEQAAPLFSAEALAQ